MRARGCCAPWWWAGLCALASLWQAPQVAGYALNTYTTYDYLVGIKYDHSIPLEARSERYRHRDNYEPFALTQALNAKKKYVMAYLEVSATVQAGGQVAFCVVQGGAGASTLVFTVHANATDFLSYTYRAYGISEAEYHRLAAVSATVGATLCNLTRAADTLTYVYNSTDSLAHAYGASDTQADTFKATDTQGHAFEATKTLAQAYKATDSLGRAYEASNTLANSYADTNTLDEATETQADAYEGTDTLAHAYEATDMLAHDYDDIETPRHGSSTTNSQSHASSAIDSLSLDSNAADSLRQGSNDIDSFLQESKAVHASRQFLSTTNLPQSTSAKETLFQPAETTDMHSHSKSRDIMENLRISSNKLISSIPNHEAVIHNS